MSSFPVEFLERMHKVFSPICMHTVGSICHYDQHPSLRQHVFLQPQFLIDLLKAVYHHRLNFILTMDSIPPSQRSLVTQRELEGMLTNLSENGIASVKLVHLVWSKFGYKEEHDNLMMKLLVSFNFAYARCDNDHVIKAVNALVEDNIDDGCDDLLSLLKSTMESCFCRGSSLIRSLMAC